MKFQSLETSKEYYKHGVIGTLRHEISILEDGIVDYCEYIDKIEEENKSLKLKNDLINNVDVEHLKERIEDLKDKVKSKMRMASTREEELLSDIKELQEKNGRLIHMKNDYQYQLAELLEQKYSLKQDVDDLRKDNKWLADKNKEIIKKKDNEIKELKLAIVDQEDDIKSLNVNVNSKRVADGYVDELKAEIKSLNELITAKHIKRNEDSNLIASLQAEIKELKEYIRTFTSPHNNENL